MATVYLAQDRKQKRHVDAVIDGSVQRSGNQLRLCAQLVRVANDSVLWSETYPRQLADVFVLQDRLFSAIVAQLRPTLGGPVPQVVGRHATHGPEAYDLYLQGRFFLVRREREGLLKATDYVRRADRMRPDPRFQRLLKRMRLR